MNVNYYRDELISEIVMKFEETRNNLYFRQLVILHQMFTRLKLISRS